MGNAVEFISAGFDDCRRAKKKKGSRVDVTL